MEWIFVIFKRMRSLQRSEQSEPCQPEGNSVSDEVLIPRRKGEEKRGVSQFETTFASYSQSSTHKLEQGSASSIWHDICILWRQHVYDFN